MLVRERKLVSNGGFRAEPLLVSGGGGGQVWGEGEEAGELRGWSRMDRHVDIEVTQNDGRCRVGEEENGPGTADQSERDGQEGCFGSVTKGGAGGNTQLSQL